MIADSSYFVALADSKDRWHKQALGLKVPRELVVTDLIVAESVTIVGNRGGGKAGQTLYEYFVDECNIVFVDAGLLDEAMALHLQYDGTLSVADCASVALMSRKGIGEIVSFDSDFDKVRGIGRIH
ncbi:MAG: type II toxin-antitoxin system VapC family toxin [Thermoplasmata archaeon]|nr:type II toxin-antitoxin system VapC family toxin [Thermoplasmata archaeon]